MIVKMESIRYDENSTEMKDLVLRGVNVGKYSFGLYSKWVNNYKKIHNDVFQDLENYLCGILHRLLDVDVLTSKDISNVQDILRREYGKTMVEWFEDYMRNDCRAY